MELEWGEHKRQKTIAARGVNILYAAGIFEGPVLSRVDDRGDYGEERVVSIGLVEDECFVVVHTERHGAMRLITAWKGRRDERSEYQAGLARGDQTDAGSR